jgi:prepilin-type N-terminal cleavage/methylation domain-containing protein
MPRQCSTSSRAFTLVEMLAVVAILALTVSAAAVALTGMDRAGALHAAAANYAAFDAQARATARTSAGAVTIRIVEEGASAVIVIDAMQGHWTARPQVVGRLEMPGAVTMRWAADEPARRPLGSIALDRNGRGRDYLVEFIADERRTRWRIGGLTGCVARADGQGGAAW